MQVNKSTTKNVESTFINIIIIYSGKKNDKNVKFKGILKFNVWKKMVLKIYKK